MNESIKLNKKIIKTNKKELRQQLKNFMDKNSVRVESIKENYSKSKKEKTKCI